MAEGKNKVIVYRDWLNNFEELTDEELGKLMRHFFEYINDLDPVLEDRFLKIAWKPIETTLKRDLKSWEQHVDKQRENGLKGGRPKKPKKPTGFSKNPTEPKKADSVSDSVTVSDSVKENDNERKEVDSTHPSDTSTRFEAMKFLNSLGVDKQVSTDFLKTRKTKRLANTETAFKSLLTEIEKTGRSPNEIITICAQKGWGGFKASWEWNTTNSENKPQSFEDFAAILDYKTPSHE